ncbi:MAG: peptide chain release factor N(5)-glutamine methyltransferase [Bacillota bacterium]
MDISQWLNSAGKYLSQRRRGAGRIDAEAILGHLTGMDRSALYRDGHLELSPEKEKEAWIMAERRAGGEPLAYITGHREFMGMDFLVTPAVLIPRPETELLVEKALEILKEARKNGENEPVAADIGTGCGAIAVSLAVLLDLAVVYATDISGEALKVARQNAERLGAGGRVVLKQGDLLGPLAGIPGGGLHLLAANLPYVPSGEIPGLMADVRDYEPHLALDGGGDGLDLYRRLVPEAGKLLRPGGCLLMEIGPGQGEAMLGILGPGWEPEILPDLAGRERLVIAKRRGYKGQ